VMGSPSFMPPEQAGGRPQEVGPASDVYALGAILYQMLTGRAPFAAESPLATLRKVLEEEPMAPSKLNSKTPPDLETICLKCLEKRPERRYHTARDLAEELERFLNHEPILAKPASAWRKTWSWARRNPWAVIGVVAAGGLALLGLAFGLWERVKFLEGSNPPAFYDPIMVSGLSIYLVLLPSLFFSRWLKGRRQRNLAVSNVHLWILAASGVVLVLVGLWSDMLYIRFYIWKKPVFDNVQLLDNLPAVAGYVLGIPLFLCWTGGILVWQAIRRQQAQWSGSAVNEEEWLPRQAERYSSVAFITATLTNMFLFAAVGYVIASLGWFPRPPELAGPKGTEISFLVCCFGSIGLTVSVAWWVFATRKLYKRPPLLSAFLVIAFVGAALGWFYGPFGLTKGFIFTAMLTGLVGGWILEKWVKIRSASEALRPLVFSELFEWNGRGLRFALSGVGLMLGLVAAVLAGTGLHPSLIFLFLGWTALNALWLASLFAARASSGKFRELFLVIVMGALFSVIFATPGMTQMEKGMEYFWMTIPVGMTVSGALIYFGKIRPKTISMGHNRNRSNPQQPVP
jgi:hypothetical protein